MRHSALWMTLGICTWSTVAPAHGPPPFVLEVAAVDDSGPRVAVVTEGLIQRHGETWHYVCPSRFGSDPSPTALSVDGRRTFVVGDETLFALEHDGTVVPLGMIELGRRYVVALVEAGGTAYAVRFADSASELRALDGSAPLWTGEGVVQAASGDEAGIWLASAADGEAVIRCIDLDGTILSTRAVTLAPSEAITGIRAVDGAAYVALVTLEFDARLVKVAEDGSSSVALTTQAPLRGLVPSGAGELWTASDGVLYRTEEDTSATVPTSTATTCVGLRSRVSYACAGTRLHELVENGLGTVLLDLADLRGPGELPEEPVARERCQLEWDTFRNDLVSIDVLESPDVLEAADAGTRAISGTPSPSDPMERREAGCGCASTGSVDRGAPPFLAVLLLVAFARSRVDHLPRNV